MSKHTTIGRLAAVTASLAFAATCYVAAATPTLASSSVAAQLAHLKDCVSWKLSGDPKYKEQCMPGHNDIFTSSSTGNATCECWYDCYHTPS